MKLIVTTNLTVDGVMQGLGGADEDRSGGFDRGGWVIPLVDPEASEHIDAVYGAANAFLFGRRTFEIFAGSWGAIDAMKKTTIGAALNNRPKYVVSTTLTDPGWAGTTVVAGDVAAAIRGLKAEGDGDLVVPGSGVLVRWLLAEGLVDEFDLITYPVIVGQGKRLFAETGPDIALELVASRTTARGMTLQTYRVAGHPTYAGA